MIAEVSTDDVSNTVAPIRDRLIRISRGVDYAPIRPWLSSCIADHRSCVSPTDKQAISHTKLIDCTTHTIVAPNPSMQYLALSYVWGQGPPRETRLSAFTEGPFTDCRRRGDCHGEVVLAYISNWGHQRKQPAW